MFHVNHYGSCQWCKLFHVNHLLMQAWGVMVRAWHVMVHFRVHVVASILQRSSPVASDDAGLAPDDASVLQRLVPGWAAPMFHVNQIYFSDAWRRCQVVSTSL